MTDLADQDRRLKPLYAALSNREEPVDLLLDDADEIIGDGLHRCQMYMDHRTGRSPLRGRAFRCRPRSGSRYFAEVVRAGANYWKHQREWPADENELTDEQKRTLQVCHDVGVTQREYRLSNLLYALNPKHFTLSALVETLVLWRDALDEATARWHGDHAQRAPSGSSGH